MIALFECSLQYSPCSIQILSHLTHYHTIPTFNNPERESLWKHRGKRRQEGQDNPWLFTWAQKEFYLLCSYVPTCDLRGGAIFWAQGEHMNKIDKGLQGNAKYQISKLYAFQFQRRRILRLVFFVPMFQLVTPGVGPVLTPGASYE